MVNWNFNGDIDTILLTDSHVSNQFKKCVLDGYVEASPEFSGQIATRIGSIFVVMITSTTVTLLPFICTKYNFKIPLYCFLFARYFGAGVIIATAFVHLMDPAYGSIGPNTCVGGWGNWSQYSWPPALMLASIFSIFIIELLSQVYVDRKYGQHDCDPNVEEMITGNTNTVHVHDFEAAKTSKLDNCDTKLQSESEVSSVEPEMSFDKQIAAFLMLEMGAIFHSIIIGLNLGSSSYDTFKTLYIVIVFHQSFEGLGIGARLSTISWPKNKSYFLAYALCAAYGLVTPISIAIGIAVRNVYASSSFTAAVVSGILDSLSAGILIYTGMVELLARDFIFNDQARHNLTKLAFNIFCIFLGCMLMALLGKWA